MIPAAAQRHPCRRAFLQERNDLTVAVGRQFQRRKGIVPEGIHTQLCDNHIWGELFQETRRNSIKSLQKYAIVGSGKHRDIHRIAEALPLPRFANAPCPGKQGAPVLVEGDREDPRVLIECPLDPVPVVGVNVEVQNPFTAVQEIAYG